MRTGSVAATLALALLAPASANAWTFSEVAVAAGLDYTHGFVDPLGTEPRMIAGGVAAGDYDRDGFVDLYVAAGDIDRDGGGPRNLLFRNRGDGTFEEVGVAAGVAGGPVKSSAPVFGDLDGDGWLDLVVAGIEGAGIALFRNRGDGTFEDVSAGSGIDGTSDHFSASLGDLDGDGDLDLALAHWLLTAGRLTLWRNEGGFVFSDATSLLDWLGAPSDAFAPSFCDIDDDGRLDMLVSGDFGTSAVFRNDPVDGFVEITPAAVTDENGMGSAVADYDNDGDLDWFVSSIWDPRGPPAPPYNWGDSGNRLYRNTGGGVYEDATDEAGVRVGFWGWGSCFADFDNDGWLDLFHVNGFSLPDDPAVFFHDDPARLFMSDGDGTFTERSAEFGIADTGQGRGVVCFDYDRDGDVDVFIANSGQPPALYRNDGGNAQGALRVTLLGVAPNRDALGARVHATIGATTQMSELRAGSNFASNDPSLARFGLGAAAAVDELRVAWPNGEESVLTDVAAGDVTVRLPEPGGVLPFAIAVGLPWSLARARRRR